MAHAAANSAGTPRRRSGYGASVIYVERTWPAPSSLTSGETLEVLDAAAGHFDAEDSRARQEVFDFPSVEQSRPVTEALTGLFAGKCAFCESPVSASAKRRVHRFRPSQEAIGGDGIVSRSHYWWLAYEWHNLYYACATCMRSAGANFPVRGARGSVGSEVDALRRSEQALLVDPCWDHPGEHLSFNDDGYVEPISSHGTETIKIFRLNREVLVSARREAVGAALSTADREIRTSDDAGLIRTILDPSRPYSAAVRQALTGSLGAERVQFALAAPVPNVGRRVPGEDVYYEVAPWQPQVEPFRLRRLELRNVRAIKNLEIDFGQDVASWTMLLGENGHGKTTVLRAIAYGLMGDAARGRLRLDLDEWIRHAEADAEICLWLDGEREPRVLRLRRGRGSAEVIGPDVPAAIAAYGAGRLPPLRGRTGLPRRYRVRPRIENLFDPHAELMPATQWLLSLDDATFDFAARSIRRLLLEPESTVLYREGSHVMLDRGPESRPLDHLSDGYRSVLTLAADLMSAFLMRFGSLDAAEGILLIDELSAHLHPRWQMRIVRAFKEAFPRLQVVATTHDPLCLRGLEEGEVVVLRRDARRRVYSLPQEEVPPVRGLRVDELLTSEIFGLNSTVDEEVDGLFDLYYDLLATRNDSHRLEQVREQLDRIRQFGTTRRERLALEAADRYLAEEWDVSDTAHREALTHEMRRELRAIWSGEG